MNYPAHELAVPSRTAATLRYRSRATPVRDKFAFSPREMQTLYLMICGRTRKQIAYALGLSLHTVDFYRRSLFDKCEARNVACLIRHAMKSGWFMAVRPHREAMHAGASSRVSAKRRQ